MFHWAYKKIKSYYVLIIWSYLLIIVNTKFHSSWAVKPLGTAGIISLNPSILMRGPSDHLAVVILKSSS